MRFFAFNLLLLALSCQNNTQAQKLISPENLQKVVDNLTHNQVILDVRTAEEVNQGFIPGSIHLDYYSDSFDLELAKLDKEKTYYVFCHSGGRSSAASKSMVEMGFELVYNLEGGIANWQAKGYTVCQ